MIAFSCTGIKKLYGIDEILTDVTFSINEGEKVGFVGSNGAGKSTLVKILTGRLGYDSGDIFIDKSKELGYLSQNLSLDSSNTIYDEMILVFSKLIAYEDKLSALEEEMAKPFDEDNSEYHSKVIDNYTRLRDQYDIEGGYVFRSEISKVLYGLGFTKEDFDKNISILSGGQKTRVALCKLLLSKPDILFLDEPTNHLDLAAIEWLESYLKIYSGTVLIISHDRFFLDAITTKTLELINGKIKIYNGNYSQFIELKKKNYELELKAFNLQQAEIKRQEDIIKKYKSFNREKSIKAAESRQKALDKIERVDSPDREHKIKKILFEPAITSGNDILECKDLSMSFGDNHLFSNVNFFIKKEDKIALIGSNGRGKTTLFNLIMSKLPPKSGEIHHGRNIQIGYYDQEQSNLTPNKTILDEVWDDFPKLNQQQVRSALASFLFFGDDVYKEISTLSGGEKCRINLLKLMLSKPNFLLLDEPTNHLDIMSREALEEALLSYSGTMLVISHDRYFLNKIVHKIMELEEYEIKQYLGNYSYYVEKKNNPKRFDDISVIEGMTKTKLKAEKKKIKQQKQDEKKLQLKIKNLEKEIAQTEESIEEHESLLCKEEVYSNATKSIEVTKTLSDLKTSLSNLYSEWENLL
ncbi:ribosomal protection-like ABC-F family protein [Oceanirhabdus seepicola]|uniref:ABC-F family ATP-binding cassette domain-containing protein n=1 Tax=Oceanirhabdus seepicola TaxID=2828781 RepID=A0A9J6P026_9CLOT|nr:ABC-F family ATP-binding cassette domain-containing protein [Oceanirhabdus seepicola]MCM1990143.1 ABC-F family ATP-binding cassette domain-containing protein [Oceanirhabdus seepicola]